MKKEKHKRARKPRRWGEGEFALGAKREDFAARRRLSGFLPQAKTHALRVGQSRGDGCLTCDYRFLHTVSIRRFEMVLSPALPRPAGRGTLLRKIFEKIEKRGLTKKPQSAIIIRLS